MSTSSNRTIVIALPTATRPPFYLFPAAEPDETLDYSVDITSPLADIGDILSIVTLSASPSGSGELTLSSLSIVGNIITFWASGGVAGRHYIIRLDALTVGGREFEFLLQFNIGNTLAVFPLPSPPSEGFGPLLASSPIVGVGFYGVSLYGESYYG